MNDPQFNFRRCLATRRRLHSSQRPTPSLKEDLDPMDPQREVLWNEMDWEALWNEADPDPGEDGASLRNTPQPQTTTDTVEEAHRYTDFHSICALPCNGPMDAKWKSVSRYLNNLSQNDITKELTCTQKDGLTPLHTVCFLSPPIDVVRLMIQLCPESLKMVTNHGDTPLSLACGGFVPAECDVIDELVNAYPEARNATNSCKECPLHIHLKTMRAYELDPCLFTVKMLATVEAVNTRDVKGRSPLYHLGRAASEEFSFVSKCVRFFSLEEDADRPELDNYKKSLCIIASLHPAQASKSLFLRDLLQLPSNLRSLFFEMKMTRDVISHIFGRRRYIVLLLLEIYLQLAIVVSFTLGCMNNFNNNSYTTVTILGSVYWLLKRIALSVGTRKLTTAGMFHSITVVQAVLLMASSIYLRIYGLNFEEEAASGFWRNIIIMTGALIWFTLILIFCHTRKGFSVFVHATMEIFKKLLNLFLVFMIIFMCFSTMFYVSAVDSTTGYCDPDPEEPSAYLGDYCTMQDAMVKVSSLFFGTLEADDFDVPGPTLVTLFFFNIIVILLLLNIIIAVMSNCYADVSSHGEIVFWDHRLDLIHDVDAITHCVKKLSSCFSANRVQEHRNSQETQDATSHTWFRKIIQFKMNSKIPKSVTTMFTLIVMSLWVLVGLCTFGLTWPRHSRRKIFAPEGENEQLEVEIMKEENQRLAVRNSELIEENISLRKMVDVLQNKLAS